MGTDSESGAKVRCLGLTRSIHPGSTSRTLHLPVLGDGIHDQTFEMFRRAKLMLDAIPEHIAEEADASGMLHGDLGLTDAAGKPLCAAIRPPTITWSSSPY